MNRWKWLAGAVVVWTGVMWAESPYASPHVSQDNPWMYPSTQQVPEDELVPPQVVPNSNEYDAALEAPPSNPIMEQIDGEYNGDPQPMWGTDRLVRSGDILTWGWLSMDHSVDNAEIFVAVLQHEGAGANDTIYHYRSLDGITWTPWLPIWYPDGDTVYQVEVIVGPGANPWVYTFIHSQDAGTPNTGSIILRRWRADGSTGDWVVIAQPGDSLRSFGVDRDLAGNLYLVYMEQISTGYRIYRTRSQDEGLTWDSPILVSSGDRDWPRIATGAENKAYIAYTADGEILRVGSYTNWSSPAFTDIESGDGELEDQVSVAASRTQPGASQTAWLIYRNNHAPDIDIHYSYTTDGGSTWIAGTPWPPTNFGHDVWAMHHPWVHVSYDYPYDINSVVVSVPSSTWDSVVFAWAYSNDPSTWNDRGVHNDYRVTGEFGARLDILLSLGGPGIAYRQYAGDEVWFDYWWNVGIQETKPIAQSNLSLKTFPISKNSFRINFSLPSRSRVSLNAYNSSGRLVGSILNGVYNAGNHSYTYNTNLKSGVYFLKLQTEKGISTRSVLILR